MTKPPLTDNIEVYKSSWIPGFGSVVAILALDRSDPDYRVTERHVFLPDGSAVEFERLKYNGIPEDMFSNALLFEHQLDEVKEFVQKYLYEKRRKESDVIPVDWLISRAEWDKKKDWRGLFLLSLHFPPERISALFASLCKRTTNQELLDAVRWTKTLEEHAGLISERC